MFLLVLVQKEKQIYILCVNLLLLRECLLYCSGNITSYFFLVSVFRRAEHLQATERHFRHTPQLGDVAVQKQHQDQLSQILHTFFYQYDENSLWICEGHLPSDWLKVKQLAKDLQMKQTRWRRSGWCGARAGQWNH